MKTHDLLLETVGVEITSDLSKYASYAREYVLDVYHDRAARDDEEVDREEAEELINDLVNKTKINLEKFTQKIKSSFNVIDDKWTGSKILISVHFQEGWDFSLYAADDFSVKVYKVQERGAPDFTVFNMGQQIDDILDAGDTDFFVDADVENDYFLLVNLLRNPEVFSDPDRALWLYTARPKADRHIYDRDNKVPSNIFLTSDAEEAFGYAQEYPDRDVYKMKIQQRYLTQTLDAPRKKNYQTISKTGWVPVESSDRLTEAKLNEAKNSSAKKFIAEIKETNFHRIFIKFNIISRDIVELDQFYAEDPGMGAGTLAMEIITSVADKHSVSIKLIMDVDSNIEALERFYTKFDFVEYATLEMMRKPQSLRESLNETPKNDWTFGAYYITTQLGAEKIREKEFGHEVKKGPLGKGIYFTGEEFTPFESLEKIVIQIRVEMNNPFIVRVKSKEELIKIVKQTDFKLDRYDGVLWLDPITDQLKRGLAFRASNVYYERNPYDLYEEQRLDEKVIQMTSHKNNHFKVFVNPIVSQIQHLLDSTPKDTRARALIDFETGTFYVWNGLMVIHDEMITMLGLNEVYTIRFTILSNLSFNYSPPTYEVGKQLKEINPEKLNSENMKTYLKRLPGFKLPVERLLTPLPESYDPYKEYEISYVELIERLTPSTQQFLDKQFEEDYNYTKNLADKIKEEGWDIKPLILTPEVNDQFSIFDGNHRINAIRKFDIDVPYIRYRLTEPKKPLVKRT